MYGLAGLDRPFWGGFFNTTKKHPFPHEMIKRDYALIIKWGAFLAEYKNVAGCSYGKVILRYITGLYRSP
jgi:hypothetical protein